MGDPSILGAHILAQPPRFVAPDHDGNLVNPLAGRGRGGPGWSVTGWLAAAGTIPPASCATRADPRQRPQKEATPMADPHQLSDQEAARRRRLWLQERHAQARELVVLLLRYAPEVEVARVLDQLPAGDLHRLARLLAHASGTQQPQDAPRAGMPPSQRGPSAATPPRP
jgi:hypothetical protein